MAIVAVFHAENWRVHIRDVEFCGEFLRVLEASQRP